MNKFYKKILDPLQSLNREELDLIWNNRYDKNYIYIY